MTELKMEPLSKRPSSPTDYLANERTFLAWIRTGIAIMAFGFVVVKFSVFTYEMRLLTEDRVSLPSPGYTYGIGIGLVVLGTVMSLLAFLRYRQVEQLLQNNVYKSTFVLTLLLTASIVLVGILLLVYLV